VTVTITQGATTITPLLVVDGYTFEQPSPNTLHWTLDPANPYPDVTVGADRAPSATLVLLFPTPVTAAACAAAHGVPGVFHLVDTGFSPSLELDYVLGEGARKVRPDPATGRWTVTIPIQEVGAL
jgi:hypothetical protein